MDITFSKYIKLEIDRRNKELTGTVKYAQDRFGIGNTKVSNGKHLKYEIKVTDDGVTVESIEPEHFLRASIYDPLRSDKAIGRQWKDKYGEDSEYAETMRKSFMKHFNLEWIALSKIREIITLPILQ